MDSKDIEHLYKEAKARWEIIGLVAELEKENKELKAQIKKYRVKAEMRREIIWEKEKKEKKKPKAKNAWLIKKLFRERKKGLDELKKK